MRFLFLTLLLAGCIPSDEQNAAEPPTLDWSPEMSVMYEFVEETQNAALSQYEMNRSAALELELAQMALYVKIMEFAQACTNEQKQVIYDDHLEFLEVTKDAGKRAYIAYLGGTIAPMMDMMEQVSLLEGRLDAFSNEAACLSPLIANHIFPLSSEGLKGLSANTEFNQDAVVAAWPEVILTEQEMENEAGSWTAFEFKVFGQHMGYLHPSNDGSTLGSIELNSVWGTGPQDEIPGLPMQTLNPDRFDCAPGLEENSGSAVCTDASFPNITFVFEYPWTWQGSDDVMPPLEEMAMARLKTIFWHAPESS